MKAGI